MNFQTLSARAQNAPRPQRSGASPGGRRRSGVDSPLSGELRRMRNSLRRPSLLFYAAVFAVFVFASATETYAQLIISEFRVRGPNGANDEFIELYNNSGADHTVTSGGASPRYRLPASNGVAAL